MKDIKRSVVAGEALEPQRLNERKVGMGSAELQKVHKVKDYTVAKAQMTGKDEIWSIKKKVA